jgi:hypothetical protein
VLYSTLWIKPGLQVRLLAVAAAEIEVVVTGVGKSDTAVVAVENMAK